MGDHAHVPHPPRDEVGSELSRGACHGADIFAGHLANLAVSLQRYIEAEHGERNQNHNKTDKYSLERCTKFQRIEGHGVLLLYGATGPSCWVTPVSPGEDGKNRCSFTLAGSNHSVCDESHRLFVVGLLARPVPVEQWRMAFATLRSKKLAYLGHRAIAQCHAFPDVLVVRTSRGTRRPPKAPGRVLRRRPCRLPPRPRVWSKRSA